MIQNRSFLRLADNSGVKLCQCIKVYKTGKAKIGSTVLVAIKDVRPQAKIKSGEVFKAVIVRLTKTYSRINGSHINCFENSVVLLNQKSELYGTRLIGPVTNELRKKGLTKILSLTNSTI